MYVLDVCCVTMRGIYGGEEAQTKNKSDFTHQPLLIAFPGGKGAAEMSASYRQTWSQWTQG